MPQRAKATITRTKAPFRRVLGVPMRVKGQVIGTINITDDKVTGAYTPDEIRLASLFADQAAIAVENARLLDQAQRELKERGAGCQFRVEVNMQYRTRWLEMLMVHQHDHGSLPPDNAKNPPPALGRLSPA